LVDHQRLSSVLIEFSRRPIGDYEVMDILSVLCDRVPEVLPVDGAGVMLTGQDGHLRFVAASDQLVRNIEALQIELGEGPCLQAFETSDQVVVTDLAASRRFPQFGPRAIESGLRAVYSFPMRFEHRRIGALNLYRGQPGPFAVADRLAGQVLADIATTSILNAQQGEQTSRLVEQLQSALSSRVVIEQAKGKLSEQLQVEVDEAFVHLRRYARNRGLRLHDVAAQVVAGQLRIKPESKEHSS
jgi:GAF domain-containing protein